MKVTTIRSNASFGKCEYCGKDNEELRPYGKNGARICYDCGSKPENKQETETNMVRFLSGEDAVDFEPDEN